MAILFQFMQIEKKNEPHYQVHEFACKIAKCPAIMLVKIVGHVGCQNFFLLSALVYSLLQCENVQTLDD